MTHLMSLQNVTVQYGDTPILTDINLSVSRGEILTIVGPNGSGKSSLLRVMTGALRPKTGRVLRDATVRLGYVPQKLALDASFPMTVRRFLDVPYRVGTAQAVAAAEQTGIASHLQCQISTLSGGQFQRALLARAILCAPHVLMLDEPTQGLDQVGEAAFYELIQRLRDDLACAVVMVSHDLHVVMSASDRVICLNGHVCCEGTPAVVSSAPEYRALFGAGTKGTMALYRHDHDHSHDDTHHHHHSH